MKKDIRREYNWYQKIRDVLRNIYSETIRIENCQIDKIEYRGDRIRVGGYITVPVDKTNKLFMKDTFVYYLFELINVTGFILTSKYIFSHFMITKTNNQVIVKADSGLKIIAGDIRLDSITATWCKKLDNTAYNYI